MCTVSVIPTPDRGFRLVANRDESRDRPAALPPTSHELAPGRRALWPTDPASSGTWVAATDAALVLALVNLNLDPAPEPPDPARRRSRGAIIPSLVECSDAARTVGVLRAFDLSPYQPFRLLAADPARIIVAYWDRTSLLFEKHDLAPLCITASGLGDHVVHRPRLDLFRDLVLDRGITPDNQDEFHAHTWPDRLHLSVKMDRPEARTVSKTVVRVSPTTIEMRYHDDTPRPTSIAIDRAAEPHHPSLYENTP